MISPRNDCVFKLTITVPDEIWSGLLIHFYAALQSRREYAENLDIHRACDAFQHAIEHAEAVLIPSTAHTLRKRRSFVVEGADALDVLYSAIRRYWAAQTFPQHRHVAAVARRRLARIIFGNAVERLALLATPEATLHL